MAAVEVQAYEDVRLTDAASVLARAFATDPVFSWVLPPLHFVHALAVRTDC